MMFEELGWMCLSTASAGCRRPKRGHGFSSGKALIKHAAWLIIGLTIGRFSGARCKLLRISFTLLASLQHPDFTSS
ncbi:hypothetical protein QF001_000031 [Paraburkholderia youngii]